MATLTDAQKADKAAFAAFIAGGCQTKTGGFQLDLNVPIVYTIDVTGKKLLASGALANVNLAKLNPNIAPTSGTTAPPVIASLPMSWDMYGNAQGNQALSLVQVVAS